MKRMLKSAVLAGILTSALSAQGPGEHARNGGSFTAPDPATMVADQVSRLTALLGLSAAQAAQATTIFTDAQTATTTIRTGIDTNQTSLQAAIKANTTATIDQVSATIGTLQGQALDIRAKAQAAFYAILTADQQTKLDTLSGFGLLGGGGGRGFGPGHP